MLEAVAVSWSAAERYAGRHRGLAAGLPDGPGSGRVHNRPNHLGAGGALAVR